MQWTSLNDLREKFLTFFEGKEHLRMASAPLIPPKDDTSLLLINSGMAPLKKFFLGQATPPRRRVTTCQKCVRTEDIEHIGKTDRHGTYFEMLGNFSFGDYFKHEATAWAWEFITKVLEMPVDKLWVTIYLDDDEAFDIWTKEVGVDPAGSSGWARRTTSGSTAPAPAAPAPRSTSTAARNTAAVSPPAAPGATATGTSSFGTSSSPSLTPTATATMNGWPSPTSTPVWALSGWPASCRGSTTSLRSTPSRTS